mgnify:CR=1 FL=1
MLIGSLNPSRAGSASLSILYLGAACLSLAACSVDRPINSSAPALSYQERHPISLTSGINSLDLHVSSVRLDYPSIQRLKEFSTVYAERGSCLLYTSPSPRD